MKENKDKVTKNITARDVAKLAGVSKWTVSRAFTQGSSISESSLNKVLKASEELGYKPNLLARGLAKNKTNMVAILISELGSPAVLNVFDELTSKLQNKGLIPIALNIHSKKDYQNALTLAGQLQVDGIIFLGTDLPQEIVEKNIEHIPLISLYRHCDTPNIHSVSTDGMTAGQQIANLFINLGYKRMAYMSGPEQKSTGLLRLDGFSSRLLECGIPLEHKFSIKHYTRELAFNCMSDYIKTTDINDRVDAIFCENDILAIGALDALHHHKIDNSIAIVGFDDIDLSSSPKYNLTTFRQDLIPLVSKSVELLNSDINSNRKILMPGKLITRQSHLINR
ncbi:LacI family DNA-binding transcriptional regulator [Vibrio sp. YIC-376]|uniref:LacI family DNA-binding transcriptional regulator n=1 Tax=Vibrio sp. YIC-376 TaxID=3136162 RepID=UPI00402B01F5